MYLNKIKEEKERWERDVLGKTLEKSGERQEQFKTASGLEVNRIYTPLDLKSVNYLKDIGFPGEYPFTRGVYPTMYRGRLWTMRQLSGYGLPEETNRLIKYLLEQGQPVASIVTDYPSKSGCDPDDPRAEGEAGRLGTSFSSLKDAEIVFEGLPLDQISVMLAGRDPYLLAIYIALAEKRRIPLARIKGTTPNNPLLMFHICGQCDLPYPPEVSLKLSTDLTEYCIKNLPGWNPITITGYGVRESGGTAIQELAVSLGDGIAYLEALLERGLKVDEISYRLSFHYSCHNDFFEEVAKLRVARRMWARIMKERFGAKDMHSLSHALRIHVETDGSTLTAQEPENNIARATIQSLAAVLGGASSLHTTPMDEALGIPTERALKIALRTQQIIAYESGVANTIDPLAGSYFVETLTDKLEGEVKKYLDRIEAVGGMIACIKNGFMRQEITRAAYERQKQVENGEVTVVGVNKFAATDEEASIPIYVEGFEVEELLKARVRKLKAERDSGQVERALKEIRQAAESGSNIMPVYIEAAKAYVTIGEANGVLREVFGEYKAPATVF